MKKIKFKKVRRVQTSYYEYTGEHTTDPVEMQLFIYNEEKYKEYDGVTAESAAWYCKENNNANSIKWFNMHGLHDTDLVKKVSELFDIETFVVSDILNTSRRTRIEEMEEVLFFTVNSVLPEEAEGVIETEQISFVLKGEDILSFQEKKSDYFEHIRERIRNGIGLVRKKKSDFLLYLMLDAIMENFFVTLERYEIKIEQLGNQARVSYKPDFLNDIEKTKDNLVFLKRALLPLRDALYNLKNDSELQDYETINPATQTYFSRLHHKCLEILDQIDYDLTALDSASNFHFSAQSQRMNQIMKTLTIVSVIFMPLTFIVGVYGMNFNNMPELQNPDGYYIVMGAMGALAVGMFIYFKKIGWF